MEKVKDILVIAKQNQFKEFDTPFIVFGYEGTGKSNFTLSCLDMLGVNSVDNIALDKDQFREALSKSKMYDVVCFDEAGDGLFNRDSLKKDQKDIIKAFMIFRARCMITFLVLPSIFAIDVYLRRHRVRGAFFVYGRGKVAFFDMDGIKDIINKCEKTQEVKGVRPLFTDTFPKYEGKLLKPYLEKKSKKIEETLANLFKEKEEKKPKEPVKTKGDLLIEELDNKLANMMKKGGDLY